MSEPTGGATECAECVAVVEAFGFAVSVVRWPGERRLHLEAVMKGAMGPVFQADAGTTDVPAAEANAKGFAAGLAVELAPAEELGPSLVRPTYHQLQDEVRRRGKDVDGLLSRLRLFMRTFGLEEQGQVGPELGVELPKFQEEFRAELMRQGKSAATIGPYLSKVNKLAEIAGSITVFEGDGLTFGETIRLAAERRGLSLSELARRAGMFRETLQGWVTGKCMPDRRGRGVLPVIERELGLPQGTLTDLACALRPMAPLRQREGAAAFAAALREALRAERMSASQLARDLGLPKPTVQNWAEGSAVPGKENMAAKLPLAEQLLRLPPGVLVALVPRTSRRPEPYSWRMTEEQNREWERLKAHKTNRTPANRSTRAGSFWKVYEDGECPSAQRVHADIRYFFGFLALPADATDPYRRGRGRDGTTLSLLDLANPDLVEAYVSFRARRTGYNSGILSFLWWLRALLYERKGYFWQGWGVEWRTFPPECLLLGDGVEPDGTLEQWRSHCIRIREWIDEKLEDLHDSIIQTRDYRHIRAILDLDHPVGALKLLLERMEADYRARLAYLSPGSRALLTRDLLFVSMLVRNPLRRKHWLRMTWRPDNTGQLRRRKDGNYEIFLPRVQFKALAGFRDEDYLARVDPALTPLIEEYLLCCRPLLQDADKCDLVFRPGTVGRRQRVIGPVENSTWLCRIVARHIPEYAPRGFSPHAVRHIIATHFVRNYDDGIDRAADALHNTRWMILKTYGHLRGRDLTDRAQRIIWTEFDR